MRKLQLLWIAFLCLSSVIGFGQEPLLDLLRQELSSQMQELQQAKYPPYHMNYRVVDQTTTQITASFGALTKKSSNRERTLVPQIRIGNAAFDNFKTRPMGCPLSRFMGPTFAKLPLDEEKNELAIRQAIWDEVNNRYKYAVDIYQTAKAQENLSVSQADTSPCFSNAPVEKYYEKPLPPANRTIEPDTWVKKLKEISVLFKKYPEILRGDASLTYTVKRIYFLNTEGTEIAQNLTYTRLMVHGMTKAEDGMELPLTLSYFAYTPENLPTADSIMTDVEKMAQQLVALRQAPLIDPFTGPALLSGSASGVFFHEIFGHRIEGQRMKNENDAQTFKKMIGEYVLAPEMQVYADPTLRHYAGYEMNGFYHYDDQGVKAQRVDVVVDGKLHDFLMTRVPLEGHPQSNGHARADLGYDPVSRQSNLIVETKAPKTEAELRQLLIDEIKKQGKEYGYYFKKVTGGFTMTGRAQVNSFNVTPLEVYEVFADGRPDRLVRGVNLIGTPLSMFSNIIQAGKKPEVFTGTCGAESGAIPVTATSPTILVKKVETQSKARAKTLPPILKSPLQR